jgi:hypothetical protein
MYCQNSITKLREVSDTVYTFTDVDECIGFIDGMKTKRILMISSSTLGLITVPIVHDLFPR